MRTGLYFNFPSPSSEHGQNNGSKDIDDTGVLSRFAVAAESLGYDCLLFAEPAMVNENNRSQAHTFVQQLIDQTSSIRIGIADSVIALEEPLSVAERVISTHRAQQERHIACLAVGEFEEAFFENDIPFEQCRDRFDETLDILANRLSGVAFEHSGKHFNVSYEQCGEPISDPTIWVTARDYPTLSSAAKRGYSIMPHALSEHRVVVDLCETFARMVTEQGRELQSVERPIVRDIFIANSNIEAENRALDAYMTAYQAYAENCELIDFKNRPKFPDACSINNILKHHLIIGDADTVAEQLRGLANDTQCTQIIARMYLPGIEEQHAMESASLLTQRVMPALEEAKDMS